MCILGGSTRSCIDSTAALGQAETGHNYADPSLLAFADRNIDVLVLSKNATDVHSRLKWGPLVLPLDGMLSQGGEVFFKVSNTNTTEQLNLSLPFVLGHSIYWDTHIRLPVNVSVPNNSLPSVSRIVSGWSPPRTNPPRTHTHRSNDFWFIP